MYSPDIEADPQLAVRTADRHRIRGLKDAMSSPMYNGSVSGLV